MIMYIGLAVGQIAAGYTYAFLATFGWKTTFYVGGIVPILLAPLFYLQLPEPVEYLVVKGAPRHRIADILSRIDPAKSFNSATELSFRRKTRSVFRSIDCFRMTGPR
jgi:AAHS family 4-hydroxybenzoate transporter-like MFS transporter